MHGISWIIAQTPIGPSGDSQAWNPVAYEWLGPDKFMLLAFACLFAIFVWRALGKWDTHLTRAEQQQKQQLNLCQVAHARGGVSNVEDLREAGHAAANVLLNMAVHISPECGEAVKPHVEKIHDRLRSEPPTK